ncbi:MAG: HesA/MoeB/ThiF family protein [Flavobacteriales bacterium]|jgi:adenylyltransferase/sulfurtransferase|nr:HesA/MoeB/ThiF family protein [Flavobacteriales bacterium]
MRYDRHIRLEEIGIAGQKKIGLSKVLVIGAGGLGCPVLQYLSAAGVGTIGIVDGDQVSISNLQRQILFSTQDIGKNKAEMAKKRLEQLNPEIQYQIFPFFLSPENALEIFTQFDIIVDGTDNFSSRYMINDASLITGKPLVSASIQKFSGQLSVFNYQNGPSYRCLFPEPPKPEDAPSCQELGVLGVLPGILGTWQANEVLKIILQIGNVLSGAFITIDTLSMNVQKWCIEKDEYIINSVLNDSQPFKERIFEYSCRATSFQNKSNWDVSCENMFLLDVREKDEFPKILGAVNIPLSQLDKRTMELPRDQQILVFCEKGIRSLRAIEVLENFNLRNLINLKFGLDVLPNKLKLN